MRALITLAVAGVIAFPAFVAASPRPRPIGASVAELLAVARQTSPEVAAAALDAEAAAARITVAGALPDPVASVQDENFARHSTSGKGTTLTYKVMQEFSLWGKRELREDIAVLDAKAAGFRRRSAELELEARIKSVFAARNASFVALKLNKEILNTVNDALTTAHARFAQSAATQEDVTKLEIESADLAAEMVRLHAQIVKTAAQLNALLSRRPDAPLAVPAGFRRLPPDKAMTMTALVDRAVHFNSDIAESAVKASAAATGLELANRNRYPDISLGTSVSQENGRYGSSAFMGEFRIPLQWGAKEAAVRAAAADQAAADARLRALKQRVAGEVAGMIAEYKSNAKSLMIMREHHLPDAQLALKSALALLPSPSGNITDAYAATQRLLRIQLDILKLDTEQQVAVAEIEKIIGGDL
jgi:cobalt-zinc-cadmium efflux system outer membrane protein